MNLRFKHGSATLTGEANPRYSDGKVLWWEVVLDTGQRFTVEQKADGTWKSDFVDINKNLVVAVGDKIKNKLVAGG
jgi:hypothetical protein